MNPRVTGTPPYVYVIILILDGTFDNYKNNIYIVQGEERLVRVCATCQQTDEVEPTIYFFV